MYEYIASRKDAYQVNEMCLLLHVSESGYYRWLRTRGKPSKRELLSDIIREILAEDPDNSSYGVDRILLALRQRSIVVSRSTVRRIMRENGWLHPRPRRPHGITRATTEIQERENLLKGNFTATAPGRVFLSDITEIQCSDGKLYVSPVMDCFSGEIVALVMRDNMKKELCVDTVRELALRGMNLENAIFHTDRGCQYTSSAFRAELRRYGLVQSLSGVGRCFDNVRMESFFATLKKEKIYQIAAYKRKREEVRSIVFRYVHGYYNCRRICTTNPQGLPPTKYREEFERTTHKEGNTQNSLF